MQQPSRVLPLLLTALLLALPPGSSHAQPAVPLPTVRGPLPVSEDSRPWLAASHTQTPIDLAALGWVEEEFLISGNASVHDWGSDSGLVTLATAAPYGTRLLLRRPADPSRFNGTVVVELLNDARVYDWAFLWALSWQHFVDEGMVWVGISHTPQAIEALKHFDAARYAGLGMANPTPTEACGQPAATSPFEEGLQWDAISQAGALLKADRAGGPLQGFAVQRLFLTSHHGQAGTYANSLHPQARLADGRPVYDGFLLESADATLRLRRCGSAPAAGDERQVVRNAGVPVIRIVPEGEALAAAATRRADSDDPADPFRQLEIPAAPRMDRLYFEHLPAIADQLQAGQPASNGKWPYDYRCEPDIDLLDLPIKRFLVNGAFANLERWASEGTPPPRAERLQIADPGTAAARFVRDEAGNVQGGVRHPYVTVPTARYAGNSPPRCATIANRQPFGWARLQQLYGSPEAYAAQAAKAVEELEQQRWVTPRDAGRLLDALTAPGW